MKNKLLNGLVASLALIVSGLANAGLIDFEDAWDDLGYTGQPGNYYLADGLTIGGNYFGLISGVTQGDSGNFDLEGTNSPAVLAVNTIGHTIELIFGSSTNVSLDIGVAFGNTSDVLVSTFLGGNLISSNTLTISDTLNGGFGTWTQQNWVGVDKIELQAIGQYRAWAIDNVQFTTTKVPEPSTLAVFALGLMCLGSRKFKKQS